MSKAKLLSVAFIAAATLATPALAAKGTPRHVTTPDSPAILGFASLGARQCSANDCAYNTFLCMQRKQTRLTENREITRRE